jgi:predicted deacetylase
LTASISAVNDAVNMAATVLSGAYEDLTQLKIDVAFIRDFTAGRWKMSNNQMIFYKEDNLTEIARFNLFDDGGNPSMESVFERKKIVS